MVFSNFLVFTETKKALRKNKNCTPVQKLSILSKWKCRGFVAVGTDDDDDLSRGRGSLLQPALRRRCMRVTSRSVIVTRFAPPPTSVTCE
jgi:hypothetical protein